MVIVMTTKISGPISPFSSRISTKIVPFEKFQNRKSICFIAMNCFPGKFLGWNQVLEANTEESSLFSIKVFSLRLDIFDEELHHTIKSLWLISKSGHIELRVQLINLYIVLPKQIHLILLILESNEWYKILNSLIKMEG